MEDGGRMDGREGWTVGKDGRWGRIEGREWCRVERSERREDGGKNG
jgi:hypothetical protein